MEVAFAYVAGAGVVAVPIAELEVEAAEVGEAAPTVESEVVAAGAEEEEAVPTAVEPEVAVADAEWAVPIVGMEVVGADAVAGVETMVVVVGVPVMAARNSRTVPLLLAMAAHSCDMARYFAHG